MEGATALHRCLVLTYTKPHLCQREHFMVGTYDICRILFLRPITMRKNVFYQRIKFQWKNLVNIFTFTYGQS